MSRSAKSPRMGRMIKGIRNPSDGMVEAEEMARSFHGRDPREIIDLIEEEKYDKDLAVLGILHELTILKDPVKLIGIPIQFCKIGDNGKPTGLDSNEGYEKLVKVCSDGKGTNISFHGGNQYLDIEKLFSKGLYQSQSSFNKRYCIVGICYSIVYWADKHHLQGPKSQAKGTLYEHHWGEQKGGEMPTLVYDTKNERIMLSGGSYEIRAEGIWN